MATKNKTEKAPELVLEPEEETFDKELEKLAKESDAQAEAAAQAEALKEQKDLNAKLMAEIESMKAELKAAKMKAVPAKRKPDALVVQELCEECAKTGVDPWTVKVTVFVPKRGPQEDPWYWIQVNAKSVQLPANNTDQEMKLPFADTLMKMLQAEDRAQKYQDELKVYDPKLNPHEYEDIREGAKKD